LFYACKNDNSVINDTDETYVVSTEVTTKTTGEVIFVGNCTGDNEAVTERGFIYSREHNPPTFQDEKIICSLLFSEDVTDDLTAGERYYACAYVINEVNDTIIGNVVEFEHGVITNETSVITNEAVVDTVAMSFVISASISGSPQVNAKGFLCSCENPVPVFETDSSVLVNSWLFQTTIIARKLYRTYYMRAFIITEEDTIYGNVIEIPEFKPNEYAGMTLVWHDEFNNDGEPDPNNWAFESGFVRNSELQWYQRENASCSNGKLIIRAKKEQIANPNYVAGSSSWKTNREYAEYTSASLNTNGRVDFKYGRLEVRARFPAVSGSWPAIWTLGRWYEWPFNGEIDLFEYYSSNIHANACWGSNTRWSGVWDSASYPLSSIAGSDTDWEDKFHIWRMDWNEKEINLYLDNRLLNTIDVTSTWNGSPSDLPDGQGINPFRNHPHYILLNLAIGSNGGTPDDNAFPLLYEVDYVRVYKEE
jgi:beta-glucanase (GH16 family)